MYKNFDSVKQFLVYPLNSKLIKIDESNDAIQLKCKQDNYVVDSSNMECIANQYNENLVNYCSNFDQTENCIDCSFIINCFWNDSTTKCEPYNQTDSTIPLSSLQHYEMISNK